MYICSDLIVCDGDNLDHGSGGIFCGWRRKTLPPVAFDPFGNGRWEESGLPSTVLGRYGDGRDHGSKADTGEVPGALCQSRAVLDRHGGVRRLSALGASAARAGPRAQAVPAKMVRPFVGGNKSDAHDARAIWTAVQQPGIKTVAIKSEEQQAVLALHRMRQQLVKFRTAQINGLRGLLAEYGEVIRKAGPVCAGVWPAPSSGSRSGCRRSSLRPCASSGRAWPCSTRKSARSSKFHRGQQCTFLGKAATDSDLIRSPIPRQNGQSGWICDRVRWVIPTGASFAPFREKRGCPGRDCPCVKYTTFYGCMPADCRSGGLPSVLRFNIPCNGKAVHRDSNSAPIRRACGKLDQRTGPAPKPPRLRATC